MLSIADDATTRGVGTDIKKRLEAKDASSNINRTQTAVRAKKCHFLSLITLTFDLDLQTRPSEGPNTSSL